MILWENVARASYKVFVEAMAKGPSMEPQPPWEDLEPDERRAWTEAIAYGTALVVSGVTS